MTQLTPDEHSDVVGGSTAARVLACPGSVRLRQRVKQAHLERILQQIIPEAKLSLSLLDDFKQGVALPDTIAENIEAIYREETTSPYAAEGTGLHEAMAWILTEGEEPESVIDRTFEGILITPQLFAECIEPAIAEFDAYLDRVFEEDGDDLIFAVEKRCQMPGIPGAYGTSDIIGKTSKRVTIIDWKFGGGVYVSPKENKQGMFYARSACYTMKDWLGFPGGVPDDTQIDIVIIQPRFHGDEPNTWTTNFKALEDFRNDLIRAVSEALHDDNAKVSKGPHCKFCEAEHICPAKQQLGQRIVDRVNGAYQAVEEKGEPVTDKKGKDITVSKALSVADVQFTPQTLKEWYDDAKDIEAWCKWVKALCLEELEAGREVAGFELDQGLGNSAWTVDEKTVDRCLASYGLDVNTRRVTKSISPTQARKQIEKLGNEKHMTLLEKIIERPLGAMRMVPKGTAKNPPTSHSETREAVADKLKDMIHDES